MIRVTGDRNKPMRDFKVGGAPQFDLAVHPIHKSGDRK
jgi:hypothetical protein